MSQNYPSYIFVPPASHHRIPATFHAQDRTHLLIFIDPLFCLTSGPYLLTKPLLHTVQSNASSFNLDYPLFHLHLSSSCVRLLYRLPVTISVAQFFPSGLEIFKLFSYCLICGLFKDAVLTLSIYSSKHAWIVMNCEEDV